MKYRYFIELQYNGANYHGWQVQPNALSVQQELNTKLSLLLNEIVITTGAGRTDTGVHARFFVAHFDLSKPITTNYDYFLYKLNRFLPNDIHILKISPVALLSHARFDAISRTYRYYISSTKDVFNRSLSWQLFYELDHALMNNATSVLLKSKDFTSFSKVDTDVYTNLCDIKEAYWERNNNLLIFTITADRFLRNMVRAIVGTMVAIGRKKITFEDFLQIIEGKDRKLAGESAPPQGLFLEHIAYPYKY